MSNRLFAPLLAVGLLACLAAPVRADRPGFYSNNVLQGGSSRVPDGPRGGDRRPAFPGRGGPRYHDGGGLHFHVGPGYYSARPFYAYPYLDPSWSYGYGTGIYYDPATNTTRYYLPPTFIPGELMYGPLAAERFLGIPRGPIAVPPAADGVPDGLGRNLTAEDVADKLRNSNDEARARARRFMELGDAQFQKQQFNSALQRYKSAIEAAPDLVDAYVHQGFALLAVGQYRLAAKALKIAVELDPEFIKAAFQLDDLYGPNRLAATSHLEMLAQEAMEQPENGDLLFLVGMMLYADGEPERARKFFRRAVQLGGPEAARWLAPLLTTDAPAEAVPALADQAAGLET